LSSLDISFTPPVLTDTARELIDGGGDLHVHPSPSPFPRRISIFDAAQHAHSAGFRAIVVKSHHHSMVTDIKAVEDVVGTMPVPVFSGIALNDQEGGLNPAAVDLSLRMGGRIVWFPTLSSSAHIHAHSDDRSTKFPVSEIPLRPNTEKTILDADSALKPEVLDILDIIKENDAILTGGHLPPHEMDKLFTAAKQKNLQRILINHPNFISDASIEFCQKWAKQGVYIEHSLVMFDEEAPGREWELQTLIEWIEAIGVDRTILASDLGQRTQPIPIEAFGRVAERLFEHGYTKQQIFTLVGGNAGSLLGI
jgi:hypothetical protein